MAKPDKFNKGEEERPNEDETSKEEPKNPEGRNPGLAKPVAAGLASGAAKAFVEWWLP